MDAATKSLLDGVQQRISEELARLLADRDALLEQRIADSEQRSGARLDKLESAVQVLDEMRLRLEASVNDVKIELKKLTRHWERSVRDLSTSDPGIIPTPKTVTERPPALEQIAVGPSGHRVDNLHRDDGFRSVFTQTSVPVKGASSLSVPPSPPPRRSCEWRHPPKPPQPHNQSYSGRLPKLQFPLFEGENPKLWLSRCEDYLEMYFVPPHLWVRVAVSQIKGAPARWTQAVEGRLKIASWPEFTSLFLERFGRDQQELLLRQFFRLHQSGSVSEYVQQFSEIVDQLIANGHNTDPLYYTMRFVDGLREDIRATVILHRPSTLDSACSLALLQEEVASHPRRPEFRRPNVGLHTKPPHRGPLPLPPPPQADKLQASNSADDKRSADHIKTPSDKFSALPAYRRARGL